MNLSLALFVVLGFLSVTLNTLADIVVAFGASRIRDGATARPTLIRRLRDSYGANRLMWATDCPYQVGEGHTYGDSIALIRDRLDFLSAEDKAWMLRGTAEKVFFSPA